MDIKEIALKVASELDFSGPIAISPLPDHLYIDFAEALVAELAKQNEPVGWFKYDKVSQCWHPQYDEYAERYAKEQGWQQLYTIPLTAEQIANETAEACAELAELMTARCAFQTVEHYKLASAISEAIRSGAWKEFKKS